MCVWVCVCTFVRVCVRTTRLGLGGVWSVRRVALYMCFMYECVCVCLGWVWVCVCTCIFVSVCVCVRLGWVWVGMERAACV